VRIDDFISQLIAPVPATPPRRQGGVAGVDGGSLGSGSRRRASTPAVGVRSPQPLGNLSGSFRPRATDSADLSTLPASRAGAARGDLTPFAQPASADDPAADPSSQGFSVVESFIRKRAVMSYRLPQAGPNGAQADFTIELEVAYRVIDVIPGGLLDTQA